MTETGTRVLALSGRQMMMTLVEHDAGHDISTEIRVVVGPAQGAPGAVVCPWERSKSGTTFALADVASGPHAGTYFATTACPVVVNDSSFATFRSAW